MRGTISALIVSLFISAFLSTGSAQTIARLDGSTITPAQVDAEVERLLKAGEVTGAAIAIFNRAASSISKLTASATRRSACR